MLVCWFVQFTLTECKGMGAFGQVWKAKKQSDPQSFIAVKIFTDNRDGKTACETEKTNTPTEAECRNNGNTTLCLHTENTNCNSKPPYLVTDFIDGYDLSDILKNTALMELKQKIDIGDLWKTLSMGLHLYYTNHRKGQKWTHGDIKPANIMTYEIEISHEPLKYKIVDFGLATNLTNTIQLRGTKYRIDEFPGTPYYMHPQLL